MTGAQRGQPRRISFFGHFGSDNSGNESTLLAIASRVRSVWPDADLRCICIHSERLVTTDAMKPIPVTTREGRIWDRELPLPRRLSRALAGIAAEAAQYRRAFGELKGTDMLIVPGTGLVTDAFGLANWGPYSQFKWVLMAKLRRTRVLYVSVGAGPVDTVAGRRLVRAALSLADYRSYRDEASRECMRSIGVRVDDDRVFPDLVFGLPVALPAREHARAAQSRPVVGLGLMVFPGRYSAADPHPRTYRTYLDSLAAFAEWLLTRGYDIRLLLGDNDTEVLEDFTAAVRARAGGYDQERIRGRPLTSVDDLLTELAATDFVVATRFHNVLLATMLDKPVIAISFHHKCESLMREMHLSDYCHDIDQMDADRLIDQFQALERNRDAVTETIGQQVTAARAALDEQYELLFGAAASSSTKTSRDPGVRDRLQSSILDVNERIWNRLPAGVRDRPSGRAYGARLHAAVCRRADRQMYLGTHFHRNRPSLELIRRVAQRSADSPFRIAVLGCSIGVEVYSILWTLRTNHPDLDCTVHAIDIAPEAIRVAERGVYSDAASAMVHWSIFQDLTDAERTGMFDWDGDQATIAPWLREDITWGVGDASDPELPARLGPHELVVANNFLCHMPPADARACMGNMSDLVADGGHLLVTGVDLDVRTEIALERGWEPIAELRDEIHDGDPFVRADWPWRWWGLEPLDRRRPDWETRYAAAFRVTAPGRSRPISAAVAAR
ncbi:MAG TPA: polysaccharide pyruvyl transferase family protein [Solirubrobacteraceae bacterium]|nr:polysaccharide pyruvyl transferase family protein [Solirubrobacteraceae bacterium]